MYLHIHSILRKTICAVTASVIGLAFSLTALADDAQYDIYDSPVPQNMLVLGDSIATGFGLEGYKDGREKVDSYANMLLKSYENELPAGKETLTNLAYDGQTSAELLDDTLGGKYDSYFETCDIVLISIGGNDLLHTLFRYFSKNSDSGLNMKDFFGDMDLADISKLTAGLTRELDENIEKFGDNISDLYSYISQRTDARIIIQTVYNPFDNTNISKIFTAFANSKITALNEQIKSHALSDDGSENYTVADIYTAFSGQGKELTNISKMDIHPNVYGHKIIFENLDRLIHQTHYQIQVEKPKTEEAAAAVSDRDEKSSRTYLFIIAGASAAVLTAVCTVIHVKKKGEGK